jgi:deazaflavin-dependent oxidoreductase (nitroreductase family)
MHKQQVPRIFQVLLWLSLGVTSLIGAFFLLSIVLGKARQQQQIRDRMRAFNKRRVNPVVLKMAGNRSRGYAIVKHVGRRSGREYSTPVVAKPLGDGFVIPLPYGHDTDWYRNVIAAGTCALIWNGEEYALHKPEVITLSEARHAYPLVQRVIFSASGIKEHLLLHQLAEVSEAVSAGA